jgi:excisionase family DNA binding protein
VKEVIAIDKMLSVTEAARKIGVSRQSIYRYIERGNIKAFKQEGRIGLLIPEEELKKYKIVEYVPKKIETLNRCHPTKTSSTQGPSKGKPLRA